MSGNGDGQRDPRLLITNSASTVDGRTDAHQDLRDGSQHVTMNDFRAMQSSIQELAALVSNAVAGRSPAGERLVFDPFNKYPRPSAFQALTHMDKGWVPLLPMEGIPLYQSVQARADSAKSLGSVVHELPFLYSILSYGHDVAYNLRLAIDTLQDGGVEVDALQASVSLLDKVIVLGGKRFTEIQVLVDHGAPTASLMHLQNFGALGSSVMDAGDQALLLDVKKQLLKDQKKQMSKVSKGVPFPRKSGPTPGNPGPSSTPTGASS